MNSHRVVQPPARRQTANCSRSDDRCDLLNFRFVYRSCTPPKTLETGGWRHLTWTLNRASIDEDQATDGVFPLLTNQLDLTAEEVLRAYKRQPLFETRFSQFKSDFEVAPVYLKEVTRIQALLCVYFFVLMLQTLLERERRNALVHSDYESLPLYPEHRACQAPTTRRILDFFDIVQRHRLTGGPGPQTFVTQLSPLQRQIAGWFGIRPPEYGR